MGRIQGEEAGGEKRGQAREPCGEGHPEAALERQSVEARAEPEPEEFPMFTDFWFERVGSDATSMNVYALMDSPSVTGAYRFAITPGKATVVDVKAAVFCRKHPKVFGVAPPHALRMTPHDAERGSRRIEQHGVEQLCRTPATRICLHQRHRKSRARCILPQPLDSLR